MLSFLQLYQKSQKHAPVVRAAVTHTDINHCLGLGAVPNTGEKLIKLTQWESDKMTECNLSAPQPFPLLSISSIAQPLLFSISLTSLIPGV